MDLPSRLCPAQDRFVTERPDLSRSRAMELV